MLVHRVAREFIIARLRPISGPPVNKQHNGDSRAATHAVEELPTRIVAELLWHFCPQLTNSPADGLQLAEDIGIETGPTRVADLLFPLRHIKERLRHAAFGTEQVDLKDAHILAWTAPLKDVFERSVGDQSSIPIRLAVDLDRRKTRGKRATCHDMLRADDLKGSV